MEQSWNVVKAPQVSAGVSVLRKLRPGEVMRLAQGRIARKWWQGREAAWPGGNPRWAEAL